MKLHITLLSFFLLSFFTKSFSQTTLAVGDVAVVSINSANPDKFSFVLLKDITSGTVINFTDNGFTGSDVTGRTGEGFLTYTAPSAQVAGTVISWTNGMVITGTGWSSAAPLNFAFNGGGDQLFAFQGNTANWATQSGITLLFGMNYGIALSATSAASNTVQPNASILPATAWLNLPTATNANGYFANGATPTTTVSVTGTPAFILSSIVSLSNWVGTTATAATFPTYTFTITGGSTPTVNLSLSSNTGTEAGTTAITATATLSATVATNQTVNLAVTGTNITAGDYTLSNTVITIPSGTTTGTVTFTVVDDVLVESTETATLTISNPSAGISLGGTTTQNITITDNDVVTNAVNLTVSTNTGTEAGTTLVTITATADAAVAGNQTVNIAVSGTNITATDFSLSSAVITILNGATTGTVTFKIKNDAEIEGTETAILTISNPSIGIILGATTMQNIAIADNTCQELLRKSTATSVNGAEISAYDSASKRVYTVAGPVMEYYALSNTGILSTPTTLAVGFTSTGTILPNSVAIKNGIVAVAYAIVTPVTLAQQPGVVAFYDAATATYLNSVTVGYLPDMIIFTPDGNKVLTANEGEPNSYGVVGTSFDPEGSVSIIDISSGVASATVNTVGFTSFNGQMATLKAAGVRIYGPGATVAQDLEPEYIAFNADATKAFVTLQENNAIVELNMATSTFTQILPLGLKNHNLTGNGLDASDRDLAPAYAAGTINIQNWPIKGMYQPDAMASFMVGGTQYFITANEGDSRAYTGFNEEARVATLNLDATVFPTFANLKLNQNLGRLQLTNATGDTDGDGDFDELHALGARSFSIWNSSFAQIFDSGDQLEQITAAQNSTGFNSDGTTATFDTRSDNKGPEPEAVTTGMVNGVLYAFVGSERTGDILVYDISNPAAPVFKQYIDHPTDLQVEGLLFVPANQSPTGKPLVIASAEISKTVTVYEFSLVTNAIATTNTVLTTLQDATTNYGTCTNLVAKIAQIAPSPIAGNVTAKVWIEAAVINFLATPLIARHYEITPSANASTATGRVTLYFTQTEFTNFNNDPLSTLDLPADASNSNGGIANLRIVKYSGTGDASGLPASYPQPATIINPTDADIDWNATDNRWEVSFNVTGFSGFYVGTDVVLLPLKLVSFTGAKQIGFNQLNWVAAANNSIHYFELESSETGANFTKIATINTVNNTTNRFAYNDNTNAAITYYRLKIIELNGGVQYSNIIKISASTNTLIVLYPNPVKNQTTLQINNAALIGTQALLTDVKGAVLQNINIINNHQLVDMNSLKSGIYLLKLVNGQTIKIVKE
jgi:uncharacterized protein